MKKLVFYCCNLVFFSGAMYLFGKYDVISYPVMFASTIGLFFLYLVRLTTKQQRLLHSRFKRIDVMSGEEFEEYLRLQFKRKGYAVETTPTTGDFGADLLLRYRKQETIVQAKRYRQSVGIQAVQEVLGAKQYYGVDNGMVVTNSFFTKAAKELALASEIELWDRDKIEEEFNIRP